MQRGELSFLFFLFKFTADISCESCSQFDLLPRHISMRQRPFDVVVIDEAAQSIELDCLIPMRFNSKHCVLVGDPQQLPAVVKAQRAKAANYARSLFERLAQVRRN